jgi:hypothetical protein
MYQSHVEIKVGLMSLAYSAAAGVPRSIRRAAPLDR